MLAKSMYFPYIYIQKTPIKMSNNKDFQDFFPTDNSATTTLKYDLITSKMMTGMQNHQMRSAPAPSVGIVFSIIGAFLQMVVALVVILFVGVRWIWKGHKVKGRL